MRLRFRLLAALSVTLFCATAADATITLNNPYNVYQTYGNVNVYSLPYQSLIYNTVTNQNLQGSNAAYYVDSQPGQIKDQVIVYTGSNGAGMTTNVTGFDDPYGAPNGTKLFATTSGTNTTVPTAKAEIANSTDITWDASLLALKSFLNGGDAIFMFNNNDTNDDQNLAIWAKIWVTDSTNSLYGRYLYLSNMGNVYGFQAPPQGDLMPLGNNDGSSYNPGNLSDPAVNPLTGQTDYVMAGGNVCFDTTTLLAEPCDQSSITINHNLGANEVAYAGMIPVLEGYFDQLFSLQDSALASYTLHMDLRLGCDPRWQGACDNFKIDNGFEQLWLMAGNVPPGRVPEPAALALVALGLLAIGLIRRHRRMPLQDHRHPEAH